MKKNEIVSIIVPAYNAERTINRCIDSILKQSYGNLEIIIINDGSKDSTEEKCMKYTKNKKIKYIRIKNSGVSNARNIGIENSSGKYIVSFAKGLHMRPCRRKRSRQDNAFTLPDGTV